jgi:hypothetical protein
MKRGELVRVSKSVWNGLRGGVGSFGVGGTLEGQIGIIIDVETTPPFLGGDEMFVVLIDGSEQRFYDDELEAIDETG